MGILSLLSGGGLKGLTSDMGRAGGLLSQFGLGAHGADPGAGGGLHFGQPGGLLDLINRPGGLQGAMSDGSLASLFHGLGGAMDGQGGQGGQGDQGGQPLLSAPPPMRGGGGQPSGLASLIQQYMQQMQQR